MGNGTESGWQSAAATVVTEFGPHRVIGMSYRGKNEHGEIKVLWGNDFLPRMHEIQKPGGQCGAFGICRCIPGVTDGSFEYIAGSAAATDAPVPGGMMEVPVPQGAYAVFAVRDLADIGPAWNYTREWFGQHPEWMGYCGPDACDCAHYPCFEYYPPEFRGDGPLSLYLPVHRKESAAV